MNGSPSRAGFAGDDKQTIAIAGGGPTGLALALALHRHGLRAEIFDARERHAGLADRRILALSYGTRQTLEWLGAWEGLPATAITNIHISHRGGLGRARLTAAEQQVPALGYVVAAADLIRTLDRAVAQLGIPIHAPHAVSDARSEGEGIRFTAGDSERTARLLAYAEGAIADGAELRRRDYRQHAVLCTVATREPHHGRAWERFTPLGPVALLPFATEMAVVYTCPDADAPALAGLDDAAFLARLQDQFGERIHFTAVTPRSLFPLGLRYRTTAVGARQVWLGNAAQTLHPVAGQGYNLALRDIRQLARTLGAAADPGADDTLSRYAASRSLDRNATIGFTDTLVRLFSNDHPLLGHARGAGLLALDLLPPLRRFVANRMIFGARAWP
ncbi:MAG: FAD-dependent monooxygenase [Rhodocyclaceae bacterium]|nr:FAD-dependent monooxygenase [Rhodocyclaceae bacterium]